MPEKPNILWICTDQQRFDTIAALGNPYVRTPNLDRLVATGVAFNHAYTQSPVCTPSRAAFLTGRYPRTTRCRQNGQIIPSTEQLVTKILADEGYTCGLVGKLHLSPCRSGREEARIDDGYEEFYWSHHPDDLWEHHDYIDWLAEKGVAWADISPGAKDGCVKKGVPVEYHQSTYCGDRTVSFIRRHAGKPWLFSANPYDPHHAFDPPVEYMERYNPAELPLPKVRDGEWNEKPHFQQLDHMWAYNTPNYFNVADMTQECSQQLKAAYYAMVELLDHQVGCMLDALDETGQRENTIIVFMSDHGEMLGDHGLYLKGPYFYDCAVRVPLIISWPKAFKQGLRSEALVELIDVAPTLLDCVGLDTPLAMQGRSLEPICRGQSDPNHHRDHVYCEYYNAMPWHTNPAAYATMLRTRNAKIVVQHGTDMGELYDLRSDPDEFENLWTVPDRADLKMDMMKRAFDTSVFTMDPAPERLDEW